MKKRLRNVNVSLVAIIAEGFLSRLSFGLISFALPLYAVHLGLSLPEIGFLASLNMIVALALKPVMGWAADRFGLKRAFVAGVGLRGLVSLLLIFAGAPWHLYAIRSVHGVSKSLRDPAANALIARHGGKKAIASAFAWYSTAKSVAGSLGKAAAGILLTLTASNFSLVFAVACVLSALPLYSVVRYVQERGESDGATTSDEIVPPPSPEVQTPTGNNKNYWRVVLPFVGLGVMVNGTARMLNGLFPILAMEYAGLNEAQTGIIYTVSSIVILFAGPLFGWLADNVNQRLVLLVRGVANTLSSAIYIAVPGLLGISLGKTVDGVGKAAFRPAWGAVMTHISGLDKRRRARTISFMNMGEDAGGIVAPILAGFLWSAYGITAVLSARILLAVITEVYSVALVEPLERLSGYQLPKEWQLMNALNRALVITGLLISIGVVALMTFAPVTLNAVGEGAVTLFADNRLPGNVIVAGLVTALGGLLLLEIWSSRPRSVPLQDGSATLDVASIRQRVATRLEALNTLHAVEVKVTGRRKGAEIRLRVLARADVDMPELIEQINDEVQDEVETQLGVRLLRQRCLVLYAPVNQDQPPKKRSNNVRRARLDVLAKRGK